MTLPRLKQANSDACFVKYSKRSYATSNKKVGAQQIPQPFFGGTRVTLHSQGLCYNL
jgi:hypothetical protein